MINWNNKKLITFFKRKSNLFEFYQKDSNFILNFIENAQRELRFTAFSKQTK